MSYYNILFLGIIFLLINPSYESTSNPVFLTTLSTIEVGTWVLVTTNPTTASGVSYENSNFNYLNTYTSVPNVGFGLDLIKSNYQTSVTSQSLMIDLTLVQKLQTNCLIQMNRTANSISQLTINYIVCDSSLFLDIRQMYVDLSASTVFTSASTLSRTVIVELSYKSKSNSTNAVVIFNTIGLEMFRLSRFF